MEVTKELRGHIKISFDFLKESAILIPCDSNG